MFRETGSESRGREKIKRGREGRGKQNPGSVMGCEGRLIFLGNLHFRVNQGLKAMQNGQLSKTLILWAMARKGLTALLG